MKTKTRITQAANQILQPHGSVFPDNVIDPTSDIKNIYFYTIDALWAEIDISGVIVIRNNAGFGSIMYYTPANALFLKQNSQKQDVCLTTGSIANMDTMTSDVTKRANAVTALVSFTQTCNFTGIRLDCEIFSIVDGATAPQYANFKLFLNQLITAAHAVGLTVSVDVPPIWNNGTIVSPYEWRTRNSSGYYTLNYADMAVADYICPLSYDYMFDIGAGAPMQPLEWLADISKWALSQIGDPDKIVMGIPGNGYFGPDGTFTITEKTFNYISGQSGFSNGSYDFTPYTASGEWHWQTGGVDYFGSDDESMMLKINKLQNQGLNKYAVWYIGSNRYGNPQGKSTTLIQGRPVAQYARPLTGTTVDVNLDTTALTINPAGTLANLTLAFVDGIYDGQGMDIVFTQTITSLSITGSSFTSGFPGSTGAGSMFRMVWSAVVGAWCVN